MDAADLRAQPSRTAIYADHSVHPCDCVLGADARNNNEESDAVALSGARRVPAVDYDQLHRSRRGHFGDTKTIQPARISGLRNVDGIRLRARTRDIRRRT